MFKSGDLVHDPRKDYLPAIVLELNKDGGYSLYPYDIIEGKNNSNVPNPSVKPFKWLSKHVNILKKYNPNGHGFTGNIKEAWLHRGLEKLKSGHEGGRRTLRKSSKRRGKSQKRR
jgi:hypothetical protein